MLCSNINAEPVVRCPFNRAHLIAQSRIQKHIIKCEKNYPGDYKVMCPYNATHRLFKWEITEHILRCSTRMNVDPGIEFHSEPKQHGSLNFKLCSENSSTIDCTENWDLEIDSDWKSEIGSDYRPQRADILSNPNLEDKELRAPLGYSEAAMKEVDEESYIEDDQSIVSSMAERSRLFTREGK